MLVTANQGKTAFRFSHGVATRQSDAAVILASSNLTSWLEDDEFMSSLLRGFSSASSSEDSSSTDVDILAAVVDGLCPGKPGASPSSGLSILHGRSEAILPSLWEENVTSPRTSVDSPSSISVSLSPFLGDCRSVEVTIPLANTVFHNGRRSTLLASQWRKNESGEYRRIRSAAKLSQAIVPALKSIQTHSSVSVPLLPFTPPRKIVAGLGNIVRQTELDGKALPASRELEEKIPRLLEARCAASAQNTLGPISIWALIIPPHAISPDHAEDVILDGRPQNDPDDIIADRVARRFARWLTSGCHIRRIRK